MNYNQVFAKHKYMKTLLISILILFTGFGANISEKSSAPRDNLVVEAVSYEMENAVLIAVLTEPIFLRSERIALEKTILLKAQPHFPNLKIYISLDSDIFFELQKAKKLQNTENAKLLLSKVIARKDKAR
ncbi:MAG: hypothetical protein RSB20_06630 [Clostridia bacterium]